MFETRPDFERWVPPALAPDGSRFWQAIVLSSNLPWYLLRHRVETDGDDLHIVQTTAIAWESTLEGVLQTIDHDSVVGLSVLELSHETAEWHLRHVTEVWLGASNDEADTGPLLFRVRDDSSLLNTRLQPVSHSDARCRLLIRMP